MSSFRQVAVADLTIINKTDLVNEEELTQIRAAVRSALLAFVVAIFPFYYSIGFYYVINQPCISFDSKLLGCSLVANWRYSKSPFRKRPLVFVLVVFLFNY